MSNGFLGHPSIQRIKRLAVMLGPLAESTVFIGGAIAPLLQTEPPFDEPRATKDADAVIATSKYSDLERLNETLRGLGFKHASSEGAHAHRWIASTGDILDLVPAGAHLGGSGQSWDQYAIEAGVRTDLGDGVVIAHASAPVFLCLKWAAFKDRGIMDPLASHDLEDILALIASRPTLISELETSRLEVREFVREQVRWLLENQDLQDLLAGHLNNAQDSRRVVETVRRRLTEIAVALA